MFYNEGVLNIAKFSDCDNKLSNYSAKAISEKYSGVKFSKFKNWLSSWICKPML
jgi:hypothetical protein